MLPSSTNPTLPFRLNTASELFDMIMVVHNLNPRVLSDLAFTEPGKLADLVLWEPAFFGPSPSW